MSRVISGPLPGAPPFKGSDIPGVGLSPRRFLGWYQISSVTAALSATLSASQTNDSSPPHARRHLSLCDKRHVSPSPIHLSSISYYCQEEEEAARTQQERGGRCSSSLHPMILEIRDGIKSAGVFTEKRTNDHFPSAPQGFLGTRRVCLLDLGTSLTAPLFPPQSNVWVEVFTNILQNSCSHLFSL